MFPNCKELGSLMGLTSTDDFPYLIAVSEAYYAYKR